MDGKVNERHRTIAMYNMDIESALVGDYGIPQIKPCDSVPDKLIGFNYVMSSKSDSSAGVHFFIDDYQFERIWKRPDNYVDCLSKYECVLTPDFSLYVDMSVAVQIWNVYRSRLIGAYFQSKGMKVIPTLQWADARSFDFTFDGLPVNSTVAVSAIGANRSLYSKMLWRDGMDEAMNRLSPNRVLVYGEIPDYQFPSNVEVVKYASFVAGLRNRTAAS